MSNDFTDTELDGEAYYRMDEEERQARRKLANIYWLYHTNKITYEKYIQKIDYSYFRPYLSSDMRKEIEDYKKEKEPKKKIKDTHSRRQFEISHKWTTKDYLMIFVLIVCILGFLIGVFGQNKN
jgi:hypothetical protein